MKRIAQKAILFFCGIFNNAPFSISTKRSLNKWFVGTRTMAKEVLW